MRKRTLCLLQMVGLVILTLEVAAQRQTIYGTVKDALTGQAVSGSSILIPHTRLGTISNNEGKFKIALSENIAATRFFVSSLGYAADTVQISSEKDEYIIALTPVAGALGEVVVTGVSKATLLRENPVAVSVVSNRQIEQTTESNIIDVFAKNVPGLNAVKTGPNISKPFIRGLGYNRVLTLYDGIRQEGQQWGDEHGIEVDAYNIEKGEVIKGPSSLIYGSDAMAGVVSLLPAMPVNTDGKIRGNFFSEYQGNNGLLGNGLRLSFANSHWSVALRGSYRIAKNYTNSIDGRVYNSGFRETNASASVKHISEKGFSALNLTMYDNLQGIPDGSRDSLTRKFTKQIFEGPFDDVVNRPIVSDNELNSYKLSLLRQHIQHYRIYTNNHYRLGKGDVDFLLAVQQNIRREYNHPAAAQQAGMFVRLNTLNYGFNYNAPAVANIDFTVGINGMYQNNKNKEATDFPIPNYNLFDAGSYIHAKWKQHKVTISGGFRYDVRHLNGNDFYTAANASTGFDRQVYPPDTAAAYLQFPAFKKSYNGTSMSLGATYQVNQQMSLKANIARGYRAPNITEFASNGLDPGAHIIYLGNRNFVPEFNLQEDIGADISFKDFSASASVFNNNIQHYIYLVQLADANGYPLSDAQGNKTYQYQQAAAQLYGVETLFNLHPALLEGFSFDNALSVIYGYNKKAAYKSKGINGEFLPLIPPMKIISSIAQNIKPKSKILDAINLKTEAEISRSQNRFLALNNTETATEGYILFNLSVNAQVRYSKNNSLQIHLQANNLFNKSYQSHLSRLKYFEYYSQSPNGRLGIYNMGRNVSLKLIAAF